MKNPSKLEDLFHAARALPEGPERERYLDEACGSDVGLRARLEALLRQDERGPELVEPPGETAGEWIGRYKLLEKIGEGGFGSVWMAEQREPVKRRVALKVIKLGMDTAQVIARFEAERQALAMMDHPNIASVLDAGATDKGRPYFVMELVSGVTLLEYCDGQRLDTRARLELFASVCNAIQHAHHKGIIHRDIKPTNVLVTLHDGVPVPKVIDFGIAKATNQELTAKTLFTGHHQIIGTPAYMSPEQAERSGLDIDTRSDVYSLGVLLYELLTGTTPFSMQALLEEGYEAMMRAIREVDPAKPSSRVSTMGGTAQVTAAQRRTDAKRLGGMLRGDLDWIVMKCLEKTRDRRYDTASGLAADVQRHLEDEPVDARPPSGAYRFQKFVRRHRVGVAATGAVGLAVLGGALLATLGYVAAAESAERATAAGRRSEGERLGALATGLAAEDPGLALVLAREGGLLAPGVATRSALLAAMAENPELATLSGHDAYVIAAQFDPTGERLLTVAKEPDAFVWDLGARRVAQRLIGHEQPLTGGAFDGSGARVLTSSEDGTARLFDARTGALLVTFAGHEGAVHRARFSPDERQVATACEDGIVRMFDATTGNAIRDLAGHTDAVRDLAWLPGGRRLVSLALDGTARVWSLDDAAERFTLAVGSAGGLSKYSQSRSWLSVSEDGERLAILEVAGRADALEFDLTTGEATRSVSPSASGPLAISRRGDRAALRADSIGEGPLVELRSTEGDEVLWRGRGMQAEFLDPEGRYAAVVFLSEFVVVDLERREVLARCAGHQYAVLGLAMSADRRRVASTSADGTVRVWDLEGASRRDVLRGVTWPSTRWPDVYLTRDLDHAVLFGREPNGGQLPPLVVDLNTGEVVRELRSTSGVAGHVYDLASSVDRAVVQEGDERVAVLDVLTGATRGVVELPERSEGRLLLASLSPNGSRLALRFLGEDSSWVRVHDVVSGQALGEVCTMPDGVKSARLACTNDGETLVTAHGSELPVLIVWDVASGRELRRGIGHTGHIVDLEITPDGRYAATRGVDDRLIVWDVATAEARAVCRGVPMDSGSQIELNDDGSRVAVFTNEATLLYDARTGERLAEGSRARGGAALQPGRFSADGAEVVTPDRDGRLWRWSVDPLRASESRVPREASNLEVERFRLGSRDERDERLRAWAYDHSSSRALCAWGERCLVLGDLGAAEEAFDRALELRPACAEAHLGRAIVGAMRAEAATSAGERAARIDAGLVDLERALDHAAAGRVYDASDRRLDPLRADPRCAELLERYGR